MPRYLIERAVGRLTREQIEAGSRRSIEVIADMPGVVWIRSYVSESEGKILSASTTPPMRTPSASTPLAGLPINTPDRTPVGGAWASFTVPATSGCGAAWR